MTTEIVLVRRIVAIDANGEPVFKEMPEVRLIEETEE